MWTVKKMRKECAKIDTQKNNRESEVFLFFCVLKSLPHFTNKIAPSSWVSGIMVGRSRVSGSDIEFAIYPVSVGYLSLLGNYSAYGDVWAVFLWACLWDSCACDSTSNLKEKKIQKKLQFPHLIFAHGRELFCLSCWHFAPWEHNTYIQHTESELVAFSQNSLHTQVTLTKLLVLLIAPFYSQQLLLIR